MKTDFRNDPDWIYAYATNGKMQKGARVIYDDNNIPIEAEIKLGNKSYIKITVEELKKKLRI